MSRLFIELYLDEDVDVLIAQLIRARGFIVTTTQEAGQLHNNDVEVRFVDQKPSVLKARRIGPRFLKEVIEEPENLIPVSV